MPMSILVFLGIVDLFTQPRYVVTAENTESPVTIIFMRNAAAFVNKRRCGVKINIVLRSHCGRGRTRSNCSFSRQIKALPIKPAPPVTIVLIRTINHRWAQINTDENKKRQF